MTNEQVCLLCVAQRTWWFNDTNMSIRGALISLQWVMFSIFIETGGRELAID